MMERAGRSWSPGLDSEDAAVLLTLAHDTLHWHVAYRDEGFAFERYPLSERLQQSLSTFVTLKKGPALRGCVGNLAAEDPLFRSVHDNTVRAASHDPRFPPVSPQELMATRISISILGPMRPIQDLSEFTVGRHGIALEQAGARAVFLPEVAVEQNWSREDTAAFLCRKAGLDEAAWRQGAPFQVFDTVVLSE